MASTIWFATGFFTGCTLMLWACFRFWRECTFAPVAQSEEHRNSTSGVAGSSPAGSVYQ